MYIELSDIYLLFKLRKILKRFLFGRILSDMFAHVKRECEFFEKLTLQNLLSFAFQYLFVCVRTTAKVI